MVEIIENYQDFKPHPSVRKTLEMLIKQVPRQYLADLDAVLLTNTAAFNREWRRKKTISRNKYVQLADCRGWYNQKWQSEPATITLVVDNILRGWPAWTCFWKFLVAVPLGDTFFHELGHHIHNTQVPEHNEREDVAEHWQKKLSKNFFWSRYPHYLILMSPLYLLSGLSHKKHGEQRLRQFVSRLPFNIGYLLGTCFFVLEFWAIFPRHQSFAVGYLVFFMTITADYFYHKGYKNEASYWYYDVVALFCLIGFVSYQFDLVKYLKQFHWTLVFGLLVVFRYLIACLRLKKKASR